MAHFNKKYHVSSLCDKKKILMDNDTDDVILLKPELELYPSYMKLPVPFAQGMPKAIDNFTEEELEWFVAHVNQRSSRLENRHKWVRPHWWPATMAYSPTCPNLGSVGALRRLVRKCYRFHKCEEALDAAASLASLPVVYLSFQPMLNDTVLIQNRRTGETYCRINKEDVMYDLGINQQVAKGAPSAGGEGASSSSSLISGGGALVVASLQPPPAPPPLPKHTLTFTSSPNKPKIMKDPIVIEISDEEDEDCVIIYEQQPRVAPRKRPSRAGAPANRASVADAVNLGILSKGTPYSQALGTEEPPPLSKPLDKPSFLRRLDLITPRERRRLESEASREQAGGRSWKRSQRDLPTPAVVVVHSRRNGGHSYWSPRFPFTHFPGASLDDPLAIAASPQQQQPASARARLGGAGGGGDRASRSQLPRITYEAYCSTDPRIVRNSIQSQQRETAKELRQLVKRLKIKRCQVPLSRLPAWISKTRVPVRVVGRFLFQPGLSRSPDPNARSEGAAAGKIGEALRSRQSRPTL